MSFKGLIPWGKSSVSRPEEYFRSLREEMDKLFDDFWGGEFVPKAMSRLEEGMGTFVPSVEVSEKKSAVMVTAELPGMNEKDIELTLSKSGDQLLIKGEKKFEEEKKEENFYRCERAYGGFRRVVALPAEVDPEKVKATFEKGVLSVTMHKLPESKKETRRIAIGG